jgi:hypothetical protein
MKKHNMPLSYKDLHVIKHSLQLAVNNKLDEYENMTDIKEKTIYRYNLKQDIEHETNLLLRISERIDSIKDKYKIYINTIF